MISKLKTIILTAGITLLTIFFASCSRTVRDQEMKSMQVYLTNLDQSAVFELQAQELNFQEKEAGPYVIEVDTSDVYQEIDGFGFTLTGGSALHIHQIEHQTRKELLTELFSNEAGGIGISYLRLSIGASDLNEHVFSYNDLPEGETDPDMTQFSLDPDRKHLIPVLKEILEINPKIKIMGSPWSAPTWMKTNGASKGGELKKEYYQAYAKYFVKYVKEMQKEGITIDAVTVQNEPLHPGNNPSMFMEAEDQAEFIREHLGPAFERANIQTRIVIYDHNCDRPDYPMTVLMDETARKYVDGSAFHLYGGKIDALSVVHNAFPEKHIYFTEQWTAYPGEFASNFSWHIENLIIGATRNWSRNVLIWNLASDPNQDPHTIGGCYNCIGALTIDGNEVSRNVSYYVIAHASKFVRPGSVRIGSNNEGGLISVAFKTPEENFVLIIQNTTDSLRGFEIVLDGKSVQSKLEAGSVATYVW